MIREINFSSKHKKKHSSYRLEKLSLWTISFQMDFAFNKTDSVNTFQISRALETTCLLQEFHKLFHSRDL